MHETLSTIGQLKTGLGRLVIALISWAIMARRLKDRSGDAEPPVHLNYLIPSCCEMANALELLDSLCAMPYRSPCPQIGPLNGYFTESQGKTIE